MPELPEVEVVRAGLERHVVGATITRVEVLHPRPVRRHPTGPTGFVAELRGRTITAARRRGKYLWLPLDGDEAVLAHLGMSGQLLLQPAESPDEKHLRVRFTFTDGGRELRFVDQRTFGGLAVELADGETIPGRLAHIAIDPLDESFDEDGFTAALRRRHTEVKRALLDQTLIGGVGNIYADEALWRARLHGARPTDRLTRAQVADLLDGVRDVLGEALAQGGTSFDSLYVDVNGQSGYFSRFLAVYGQADRPCPRCGTPIRRESFMNRSSYSCPQCQPRPRARRT